MRNCINEVPAIFISAEGQLALFDDVPGKWQLYLAWFDDVEGWKSEIRNVQHLVDRIFQSASFGGFTVI